MRHSYTIDSVLIRHVYREADDRYQPDTNKTFDDHYHETLQICFVLSLNHCKKRFFVQFNVTKLLESLLAFFLFLEQFHLPSDVTSILCNQVTKIQLLS